MHHGIQGQKWGVRRYQNYDGTRTDTGAKRYRKKEARSYTKQLNKNDQSIATNIGVQYYTPDIVNYNKKRYIKQYANGNDKKAEKYKTKMEKAQNELTTSREQIEEAKRIAVKLVKEAESKGYTVKKTEISRFMYSDGNYSYYMRGTHYKVKDIPNVS